MRRINPAMLGLALCLSAPTARGADEKEMNPVDASLVLENESLTPSPEAVRSLARNGGGLGVSVLLRVLDRVGPEQRRIIAESFRGPHAGQDRVLDALHRLAQDEDPGVRQAAIQSLEKSESNRAAQMIVSLLGAGHPDREALARAIRSTASAMRSRGTAPRETPAPAAFFEEQATLALTPLLYDPSASVRLEAVRALGVLSHPRAGDLLLCCLDDPDETTRGKALQSLLERREGRLLEPLLIYARSLPPETRRQLDSEIGYEYCATDAPRFLEMLRNASTETERDNYRELLARCRLPLAPEVRESLKRYTSDPDPGIRERAGIILEWAQNEETSLRPNPSARLSLLLTSILSAILGLTLFLWAFRLLKLRALLEGMGLSKAHSIALGTSAISGEAQPKGDYLRHPYTGELCVWYRGAETHHPEHRFWMEDETGRVLVVPRGAVLLSEDGVVSPGERIHIVGMAKRSSESAGVVLGKTEWARSLHERLADLLVGGLLGALSGDRSIRRLFDNPQDVFWIWDDARRRPMSSPGEVALIFSVALFGGAWIVVFFLATAAALGFHPPA